MPLARRNEPIPGFTKRLKRAVGRSYPSMTACAEALGMKRETLWTWACGRAAPSRLELVDHLSRGLGVSIDWLVLGVEKPGRDHDVETFGERLRHVILERYDALASCWSVLEVRRHVGGSWVNNRAHPHLAYSRRLSTLCNVSLDWLARGESWAATVERQRTTPDELARDLARRTLQEMAARQIDDGVALVLRRLARNAGRAGRPITPNRQQLCLPWR